MFLLKCGCILHAVKYCYYTLLFLSRMYGCEQQIFPFVMADLRHCSLSEVKKPQYVRLDVPLSSGGAGLPSIFSPFPILVKMARSSHWIIISLASDSGHCPNFSHDCGHIPSSESCKVYISSPIYNPSILVEPSTTVCARIAPHLTLARCFHWGLKESTAWCWTLFLCCQCYLWRYATTSQDVFMVFWSLA